MYSHKIQAREANNNKEVPSQRLRRNCDFQKVIKCGGGWSNKYLVLRTYPNNLGANRYGFSVGRRIGKAVQRNLIKRRLRNTTTGISGREGWDVVVIARAPSAKAPYFELKGAMSGLFERAGLFSL